MDASSFRSVKTTCPYCGVGCGVSATIRDGNVDIKGDEVHPANYGRLCSKGSALGDTVGLEDRLLYPEVDGHRVNWDAATSEVANAFSSAIKEHGPDSVALYVSGQLLTEDYYVANKLMKGYVGTANIDTNSRLCMASSVAGHKRAFGSDTVPGTYEDFEESDLLVLVGSNLAWCHPVLYQRVAAAKKKRPNMRVVVIDPRETATCAIADLHLSLAADTDVALFNGLLNHLTSTSSADLGYVEAHTDGIGDALKAAQSYTVNQVADVTGLPRSDIETFYDWVAQTDKTVTIYSQGVNQSACGTDKVNAIINTHLYTGRIGKPGMGPFSVTGQPNAMGGREVGGLANMLACHMEIANERHRDIVQRFWNAPTIASKPGLKAVDLFDAINEGKIKALWVMATNPADSLPDADKVEEALKRVPFLAVSDIVSNTDTLRHANVKLPATGWAEKDGTVTNSERMVSRQRGFLTAPGEARHDWRIICDVATKMGFGDAFAFDTPHDVFDEYALMSGFENNSSRDFDISGLAGLSKAGYDAMPPQRWPIPTEGPKQTRFFANGGFYTPNRKGKFIPVSQRTIEKRGRRFPFVMNSGRVRDHWHTMTRTARAAKLNAHLGEPFVEINPEDAASLDVKDAELVQLTSPHGKALLRALITDRQAPGTVFTPMHWNDQFASSARINALVTPDCDPFSGQPALKQAFVSIEPYAASYYGFAVLPELPEALPFAYWAHSKTETGFALEFAESDDLSSALHAIMNLMGDTQPVVYSDQATRSWRYASFEEDRLSAAVFLSTSPVTVSRRWAISLRGQRIEKPIDRVAILAGRPGADQPDPGPTICACFSVGANQIANAISDGMQTVDDIGKCLNAGTNCGSCRAEISRMIEAQTIADPSVSRKENDDHEHRTPAEAIS